LPSPIPVVLVAHRSAAVRQVVAATLADAFGAYVLRASDADLAAFFLREMRPVAALVCPRLRGGGPGTLLAAIRQREELRSMPLVALGPPPPGAPDAVPWSAHVEDPLDKRLLVETVARFLPRP
jgi:hypothetical protein